MEKGKKEVKELWFGYAYDNRGVNITLVYLDDSKKNIGPLTNYERAKYFVSEGYRGSKIKAVFDKADITQQLTPYQQKELEAILDGRDQ